MVVFHAPLPFFITFSDVSWFAGKDSFFKAHKDTPRGTDMFGSLVIVYPTAHQGGELVLRHKGSEWTFDANILTSLQPFPSLAYVAFYSDIEHEVLKVTSGSRVTLTYNLYLVPCVSISKTPVSSDASATPVRPNLKDTANFQTTLRRLLKRPEFMPEGGTLALNLTHLYPVTFDTDLQGMVAYLKGEDAHVYRSCRELELKPMLRMIYDRRRSRRSKHGVMMEVIVGNPNYDYQQTDYQGHLVHELGGIPVNLSNGDLAADSDWNQDEMTEDYEQLSWLTDFTKPTNELKDLMIAYGNEVSVGFVYCSPCLIVRIGPAGDRI